MPGHTGVILANNVIASNDSATGKFIKNYTLDTWAERYVNKGGFKMTPVCPDIEPLPVPVGEIMIVSGLGTVTRS